MAATIMQVLDTTIVNVALPNMAGQLDATPDNISWVLTSYLIASAIFMPLTGFLTDRIGQKRFLLISIAGFVVASAMCGMATSLAQMVLFRFLQGVFGASLVPLSQSIMLQIFPGEQRGKAMAIWAMGVMVAPILGPTLGGWLTEYISWRWTFYINLPVGIASVILAMRFVHDTPTRERRMDWKGFVTLAMGIGAVQLVLDRGNQDDWFSSQTLIFATMVAVVSIIFFLVYSLTGKHHPLFDLRIFKDRNFLVASLIMTTIGIGFFGGMLLQSLFLQNFLGYPTFEAGLYMAPRGVASFFVMMFVGKFSGRIAPRNFILVGILCSIAGNYMMTQLHRRDDGERPDRADDIARFWDGAGVRADLHAGIHHAAKGDRRRGRGHLQPDPRHGFRAGHLDTVTYFRATRSRTGACCAARSHRTTKRCITISPRCIWARTVRMAYSLPHKPCCNRRRTSATSTASGSPRSISSRCCRYCCWFAPRKNLPYLRSRSASSKHIPAGIFPSRCFVPN